jgi:hypothetical protein
MRCVSATRLQLFLSNAVSSTVFTLVVRSWRVLILIQSDVGYSQPWTSVLEAPRGCSMSFLPKHIALARDRVLVYRHLFLSYIVLLRGDSNLGSSSALAALQSCSRIAVLVFRLGCACLVSFPSDSCKTELLHWSTISSGSSSDRRNHIKYGTKIPARLTRSVQYRFPYPGTYYQPNGVAPLACQSLRGVRLCRRWVMSKSECQRRSTQCHGRCKGAC